MSLPLAAQTVLINETFSGGALPSGWTRLGGTASVANGVLTIGSGCVQLPGVFSRGTPLTIEFDVTIRDAQSGDVNVFALYDRVGCDSGPVNGYSANWYPRNSDNPTDAIGISSGGTARSLVSVATSITAGQRYRLRMEIRPDGTISSFINGQRILSTSNTSLSQGRIALRSWGPGDLDNVTVSGSLVSSAPELTASCTATSGTVGTAYSGQLNASGGTAPYTWTATPTSGTVPPGLSIASNGNIRGTPTTAGSFNFTARVTDSAQATANATCAVTIAAATQTTPAVVPSLTASASSTSTTGSPRVQVQLSAAASAAISGTLTLSFRAAMQGLPAGYRDPALQFAAGGTSLNFTVAPGSSTATLPQNGMIQPGTVAGTIDVTMSALSSGGSSILPASRPATSIAVTAQGPFIQPGSVRLIGAASQIEVELIAHSSSRELREASVSLTANGGARLDGQATFAVSLNSAAATWFASTEGVNNGSQFRLRLPFQTADRGRESDPICVSAADERSRKLWRGDRRAMSYIQAADGKALSLHAADIIVTTEWDSVVSRVIRLRTHSVVSHAMVYIGGSRVVESTSASGTRLHTIHYALRSADLALVYRHRHISSYRAHLIVEYLMTQVRHNCGYDLRGALVSTFGGIGQDRRKFFCSELVFSAYCSAGIPIYERPQCEPPSAVVEAFLAHKLSFVGQIGLA